MLLAGGEETTILSIVSAVLLPMFDTREAACTLRLVCREFTEAVRVPVGGQQDCHQGGDTAVAAVLPSRARCQCVQG